MQAEGSAEQPEKQRGEGKEKERIRKGARRARLGYVLILRSKYSMMEMLARGKLYARPGEDQALLFCSSGEGGQA